MNHRMLEMYATGRVTLDTAYQTLQSAIAGYLIGNKDNPARLANLMACRDYLKTKPTPEQVSDLRVKASNNLENQTNN